MKSAALLFNAGAHEEFVFLPLHFFLISGWRFCTSCNSHIWTHQSKMFFSCINSWAMAVENIKNFTIVAFLKTSKPTSVDGLSPDSEASGEDCYHSQFRPYHVIIVCEMPQCIHNQNKRDMAQQVPHGKHTLSLITAVCAGYSGEALCLFCSGLSCRGRGTLEWLHLTRSSLHRQRRQTKEDAWLPYGGEDWSRDFISSYRRGWKGHGDRLWNFSLCGFCVPRWSMIYT